MIRVLIVSDIRLYREGLADVLSRRGVVQVAGAAGSEDEALAAIDACHADVVLVDMTMLQGQATARALLANQPETRLRVEPAAVLAVWRVESGGRTHVPGKAIIRFENDLLFRLWGQENPAPYDNHCAGSHGPTGR